MKVVETELHLETGAESASYCSAKHQYGDCGCQI